MCKQMEDMRNDQAEVTTIEHLKNMVETLKISLSEAMDALKIPDKDRSKYTSMIKQ